MTMKNRSGQAALEFLTTYGWAFLIIMVMIGAISYFGIMNPSRFIPTRCTSSPEFTCTDYQIKSDGSVNLAMKQSVGKTIYFQRIDCKYGTTASTVSLPAPNTQWNPTVTQSINCTLPNTVFNGMQGQKVKVTYDITYMRSLNGLPQIASGEVYAEVQ